MEEPKEGKLKMIARKNGGSIIVTIPKDAADLMQIDDGTMLDADIEDKKYGRFFPIWNYKAQMEEYKRWKQQEKIKEAQTEKETRENTSDKYDSEKGETWKGAYADMKINRKYKDEDTK